MILFENLLFKQAMIPKFVHFEDPEVKRICVENWDKDGDGELSMEEAADVSSIGTMFANKKFISLKELQYFENIHLPNRAFEKVKVSGSIILPNGCRRISDGCFTFATIDTIDVPTSVTYLASTCFRFCIVNNLIFRSIIPPTKHGYQEFGGAQIKHFYVPDESIEAYRSVNFADGRKIVPLSEYQG